MKSPIELGPGPLVLFSQNVIIQLDEDKQRHPNKIGVSQCEQKFSTQVGGCQPSQTQGSSSSIRGINPTRNEFGRPLTSPLKKSISEIRDSKPFGLGVIFSTHGRFKGGFRAAFAHLVCLSPDFWFGIFFSISQPLRNLPSLITP